MNILLDPHFNTLKAIGMLCYVQTTSTPSPTWAPSTRDIIIGAAGGLVVLFVDKLLSYLKEKRQARQPVTIRSVNSQKHVTDDIFLDLAPGRTVALMREMLGVPTKYSKSDIPVFSEDSVKTYSYLYLLKNAYLKVTSKDNETIDTLTVMTVDKSLSLSNLLLANDAAAKPFGEMKVWEGLATDSWAHTYISTRLDSSFALVQPTGAPTFLYYTFFGYGENCRDYLESKDPAVFIGALIDGVCISGTREDSYYIYDYELR